MKERILSILLMMLLLLGSMPFSAAAATTIDSIAVCIKAPEAGRYPSYAVDLDTNGIVLDVEDTTYGECQQNGVIWFCGNDPVSANQPFEVGKVYTVCILLMPESTEYTIAFDPIRTINGENAERQYGNDRYIILEYIFPALEGHTITFNAGSGSGTMATVTNVAGEYTLPSCSFTAPHSSQTFKCWTISTDSNEWQPGEKIPVYQNVTITAVWKNKDSRVEVFDVKAASDDLASIPVLYGKKDIPQFVITQGNPAYITASSGNLQWQRKEGDIWVYDNAGRFTPGEWRIITQVRIDEWSDPSNQFVLGNPVALTVNGQAWTAENGTGIPSVYTNYSSIFFVSPSVVIADNPDVQQPARCTVTFNSNGGSAVAAQKLDFGKKAIKPADPTKSGYIFKGWTLNGAVYNFNAAVNGNITLYAAWEAKVSAMTNPFVDVKKENYFFDAVLWAVEKKITNGTSTTTFSPDSNCTRGEIVTFLWRAAGKPAPKSTKNPFKDVKEGTYYYDAMLWAVENKITTGTGADTFSPGVICSRSQAVTFLWRAAGKPKAKTITAFADVEKGAFYYDAVLWAVENEITKGTGNNKFSPQNNCSRGQIVTFLYRAFKPEF